MATDKDIAKICAGSYDPAFSFDKIWNGSVYACLKDNVLCFRGSVTLQDWIRDLDAVAILDPVLGGVHAGFCRGLKEFYTQIMEHLSPDTIVCGHSLGAARALLFAGYMEQAGIRPKGVIVFGSPRPSFMRLAEILSPVQIRSYKNRFDPVTDVPVPFYPDLPYMAIRDPRRMNIKPEYLNQDPTPWVDFQDVAEHFSFDDHHIELYVAGAPETPID